MMKSAVVVDPVTKAIFPTVDENTDAAPVPVVVTWVPNGLPFAPVLTCEFPA